MLNKADPKQKIKAGVSAPAPNAERTPLTLQENPRGA
jgi:hypothetical protein